VSLDNSTQLDLFIIPKLNGEHNNLNSPNNRYLIKQYIYTKTFYTLGGDGINIYQVGDPLPRLQGVKINLGERRIINSHHCPTIQDNKVSRCTILREH